MFLIYLKHPRGIALIMDHAGKYATVAFERFDNLHSGNALKILKKLKIGEIGLDERKYHFEDSVSLDLDSLLRRFRLNNYLFWLCKTNLNTKSITKDKLIVVIK